MSFLAWFSPCNSILGFPNEKKNCPLLTCQAFYATTSFHSLCTAWSRNFEGRARKRCRTIASFTRNAPAARNLPHKVRHLHCYTRAIGRRPGSEMAVYMLDLQSSRYRACPLDLLTRFLTCSMSELVGNQSAPIGSGSKAGRGMLGNDVELPKAK